MAEQAEMEPYYVALEKAAASGQRDKAKEISDYIRSQEAKLSTGETSSIDVAGEVAVEHKVSSWLKPQEAKDVSGSEVAGAVAGGAGAGAAVNVALPTMLQRAGKVLPGWLGKGATSLGMILDRIPVKERALTGLGGGAAVGGIDKAGEALGAPPAATFAAGLVGGGVGETAASLAAKGGAQISKAFANAATGHLPGTIRAIKGAFDPSKPLNAETATRVQAELFGEKTAGYLEKPALNDARIATAEALRKADPSLPSLTANPAPASELYRDKMFSSVTDAVQKGKTFSSTPEYADFQKKLQTLVTLGEVPKAEAAQLLSTLRADSLKGNPAVLKRYAETVDNRIRQWGEAQEGKIPTGAAAIDSHVSAEVRSNLQSAYNGYLQKLGLGPLETQYRAAYSKEATAEALDKLPRYLKGQEKASELNKMVRSISKDPQATAAVQKALTSHLANIPPEGILTEFTRLQKTLVSSKLLAPEALAQLKASAVTVADIADKGLRLQAATRLKQMLLLQTAEHAGGLAGGAAGAGASTDE